MGYLFVAIVFLFVGFFLANVFVGKKAEKKVRHIKAVRPALNLEDMVMMRAGYATYQTMTIHLPDGDHYYLAEVNNGLLKPIYEVVIDGTQFDLIRVEEEYVHV